MASIVPYAKTSKRTGKTFRGYRAFIRRTINGKSVGQSKVFATRREADQWARENETADALKSLAAPEPATGPFGELVQLFHRTPPAKGWKFADPDHTAWWAGKLGHLRPRDIDHGILNQLKGELQEKPAMRRGKGGPKPTGKPISTATVNRYLASLSSVFNFAMSRKIIDRHPMKAGGVVKEQELNQRRRVLTDEEQGRLYEAASASTWPLLRLYLRVCLTTGARRSEALRLRWESVDLDHNRALLGRTKNGSPRVLPLVDDVVADLRAVQPSPAKGYVFAGSDGRPKNINTVWRTCRERAGLLADRDDPLDRVYLHSTRHTASTRLVQSGANLAEVANVTGHKTLTALHRYTHLDAQNAIGLAQRVLGTGAKR